MIFWAWEQHKKAMAEIDADIAASRARDEERRRDAAKAEALRLAEAEAIGQVKGEVIGQARGEAIGLAKGEAMGRAKGETIGKGKAATVRRYESWLAKVAEERGIDLAELLPPEDGTPDDSAPRC